MAMFGFTQFQILTTLLAIEAVLKAKGAPKGHLGGKGLIASLFAVTSGGQASLLSR